MKYPLVKPITKDDIDRVRLSLESDSHPCLFPSHYVEKEGKVIGALSIGSTPVTMFWMHSTESSPLDSLITIQVAENIARANNMNVGLVACSEESPFYNQMEKLGYTPVVKTVIFAKKLL